MKQIIFISMALLLFSCKKKDKDIPDLAYDYFPLELGHYIDYTVSDIKKVDFKWDTSDYQLRVLVDSLGEDGTGKGIFFLNRYTRTSDTLPWTLIEIWTVHRASSRLEVNQGNTLYVKMQYPPRRGQIWDGNALNSLPAENYTVLDLDLKSVVGSASFDKTLRINQRNNINLIDEEFREGVYARAVGLVQWTDIDLTYDGTGTAVDGYSYKQIYRGEGKL